MTHLQQETVIKTTNTFIASQVTSFQNVILVMHTNVCVLIMHNQRVTNQMLSTNREHVFQNMRFNYYDLHNFVLIKHFKKFQNYSMLIVL